MTHHITMSPFARNSNYSIANIGDLNELAAISIFVVIVIAVVAAVSAIIISIVTESHRKQFRNDYNLSEENFPHLFKVRILDSVDTAVYVLGFPYWAYSNKDGTMDRRRSNNALIRPNSSLRIDQYEVISDDPYNMVQLVNLIRDLNPDVRITPCREERTKYIYLQSCRKQRASARSLYELYRMYSNNPYEFETFVAELFEAMGYETRQTARTNDGGYDIALYKHNERAIVECKCYEPQSKISRPLVQKLVGANQAIHADHMMFVATCDYSNEAEEFARLTGVMTINGDRLMQLVDQYLGSRKQDIRIYARDCRLTREGLQQYYPPDACV